MGVIVNPRGIGGSGKTHLVRRILDEYCWMRSVETESADNVERLFRPGRRQPIAYRLRHPAGGPPLVVLGHYERTSGGCDTIGLEDGGLPEIFRMAAAYASPGSDVLIEGRGLSSEVERSLGLARVFPLHVIQLDTPPEACARNLARRRRAGRRHLGDLTEAAILQQAAIGRACERLRFRAHVHRLAFDEAVGRARKLLRLPGPAAILDRKSCPN